MDASARPETVLTRVTCLTRSVCTSTRLAYFYKSRSGVVQHGCIARACLHMLAGLPEHACVHCRCRSQRHLVSQRGVENCISYTAARCKIHNSLATLPVTPTLTRARYTHRYAVRVRTTLASRTFSDERLLAVWGASWDRLGANLGSHPPVSSMLDVTGYVSSMHDETVSLMHNETRQIAISRSGLGVASPTCM